MTEKLKERQGMGEKRKRSKEKSTERGKTTRVKKVKVKKEAATSSAPDGYMKPEPAHSTDPPEPDLETESEYEEEGTSSGSDPEPKFASQEEDAAPDSEPESITTPFESPPLVPRINSELPQTELLISGEGRCNRSKRALSMLEGVSLEELRYIWQELCDGKDRMTINEKYGCFDVKGSAIKPGGPYAAGAEWHKQQQSETLTKMKIHSDDYSGHLIVSVAILSHSAGFSRDTSLARFGSSRSRSLPELERAGFQD
ncbi:hypothetical protein DL89DRAFT_290243 [Linderina pennispora]|uniref:Uncharacterized protein n=1 Tax=Linderina pennispora TaxID=61395 RepID=A0A1Y1WMH9_9FUNG|nr:uncharacterized protein DL89DRAFT_290243 [Linderina pennispora]ORX74759.1 hypothetical protein DL89DRAFT_290243 [Linderina pennispora]